jgi:dCMP deaminase
MENQRISKDMYYLGIAETVLERSTCLRRRYGAVIVNNDEIVSTGYNGAPRGEANCIDTGICERERLNVPKGERYELCVAVHAEQNAIISASRREMQGATIYIVGKEVSDGKYANPAPCMICRRLIKNAGITRVVGLVNGEAQEISID